MAYSVLRRLLCLVVWWSTVHRQDRILMKQHWVYELYQWRSSLQHRDLRKCRRRKSAGQMDGSRTLSSEGGGKLRLFFLGARVQGGNPVPMTTVVQCPPSSEFLLLSGTSREPSWQSPIVIIFTMKIKGQQKLPGNFDVASLFVLNWSPFL